MSNPRNARPGVFAPVESLAQADRRRIKALDAEVTRLNGTLTPHQPAGWEVDKAIRDERDALRLRVAELEAQVDQMIDAAVEVEKRGGQAPYLNPARPKVGRPRGRPRKAKR